MKKLMLLLTLCCVLTSRSQDITFTFENAEITTDGIDEFYEVDVMVSSSADLLLGNGQFYINYNDLAFGTLIEGSGAGVFEHTGGLLGTGYWNVIYTDNSATRVSLAYVQLAPASAYGPAQTITTTPKLLTHFKVKYLTGQSSVDSGVCYESGDGFTDLNFTACGGLFGADCGGSPGTQIFDDTFDCSGAVLSSCIGTTTYISGAWDNGIPDATMEVIIADTYDFSVEGDIVACELVVNSGITLTIPGGNYIQIENTITVDGDLIVEHEGSVVQINDDAFVVNNGAIEVIKTTLPMKPRDFMFMSSPMTAETRDGVYGNSYNETTLETEEAFRVIYLNPENFQEDPNVTGYAPYSGAETFLSVDNTFLGNYNASEAIVPGEGLIVYPQKSIGADGITSSYSFTYSQGTLNNGEITFPIQYNGSTGDNFNLLGNPYASAIDIDVLITENPMINEVYFWEHVTTPTNALPGYLGANPSMLDFSMRNLTTGMAAPNRPGATPTQYIASGQGFAIKADESQNTIAEVTFTNTMRVTGNNDQYRNTSQDKQLIWLNIRDEQYGLEGKTAIGFLAEATSGFDPGYDSKRLATPLSIFSTLPTGEQLGIQGLGKFQSDMVIPIGFATAIEEPGIYTISLADVTGSSLADTPVYLIDVLENTYVNLTEEAYQFKSSMGHTSDRFLVVFEEPSVLGVEPSLPFDVSVQLYPNPARNHTTLSYSGDEKLSSVVISDLKGQIVRRCDVTNFNGSQVLEIGNLSSGMYLVKVTGETSTVVKKLLIE